MKKIVMTFLALALAAAGTAAFVRFRYPDSEAAAFVDRLWGRARSEFSDAWERVNAKDGYSAALEKSVAAAESDDDEPAVQEPASAKPYVKGPAAFTADNRYCGKEIASEDDLRGRVVLFYVWSIDSRSSALMLPRVQRIWEALRHKPLAVVASHRGGRRPKVDRVVKAAKLTIPCYEGAGLSVEPSSAGNGPFFYVTDASGRLVFAGRSDRAATEAVINAFQSVR